MEVERQIFAFLTGGIHKEGVEEEIQGQMGVLIPPVPGTSRISVLPDMSGNARSYILMIEGTITSLSQIIDHHF